MNMNDDDPRRLDEIRKYAAIYGRFDCKRKPEKPLTLHEVSLSWEWRAFTLLQVHQGLKWDSDYTGMWVTETGGKQQKKWLNKNDAMQDKKMLTRDSRASSSSVKRNKRHSLETCDESSPFCILLDNYCNFCFTVRSPWTKQPPRSANTFPFCWVGEMNYFHWQDKWSVTQDTSTRRVIPGLSWEPRDPLTRFSTQAVTAATTSKLRNIRFNHIPKIFIFSSKTFNNTWPICSGTSTLQGPSMEEKETLMTQVSHSLRKIHFIADLILNGDSNCFSVSSFQTRNTLCIQIRTRTLMAPEKTPAEMMVILGTILKFKKLKPMALQQWLDQSHSPNSYQVRNGLSTLTLVFDSCYIKSFWYI